MGRIWGEHMAVKKSVTKVEVVEEQPTEEVKTSGFNNGTVVEFHTDRWDGTVNTLESDKLPSLND